MKQVVARTSTLAKANAWAKIKVVQSAKISSPVLWSPESPKLYQLVTMVKNDGELVDREETDFGIRTAAMDGRSEKLMAEPCRAKS